MRRSRHLVNVVTLTSGFELEATNLSFTNYLLSLLLLPLPALLLFTPLRPFPFFCTPAYILFCPCCLSFSISARLYRASRMASSSLTCSALRILIDDLSSARECFSMLLSYWAAV